MWVSPENPTGLKSGWRYATPSFLNPGQHVQLLARPDLSFPVDALLP